MLVSSLFLPLISAATASALPSSSTSKAPVKELTQNVIFTPPANANWTDPRVLYARSAQLDDGTLLATWENYSPEPPPVYFPIFRSTNNGQSWEEISRVQDTQQKWGLRYQPFLYILPEDFAGYKKGTVLLSGSSIPTDLSKTQIELYVSTNQGKTWKFLSHIAAGGEAIPNNGLTPVWEPFLMLHKKTLICYYSDQRENATYGQKMVHQTTTDLKSWGPIVNDVTYPTYTDRPGMPTVIQLPNKKFLMTYEYGGGPDLSPYTFPVYFKTASNPENFGAETGRVIKTTDGTIPVGSPYVVWSPVGGANGTIIVSCGTRTEVFVNRNLGEGPWTMVATPEATSYTRHLRVMNNDPSKLIIMGGGKLPPTGASVNKVQLSIVDITKF
ncbi:hypothetical protein ACN47E_001600 [Coniothyrium glycines]